MMIFIKKKNNLVLIYDIHIRPTNPKVFSKGVIGAIIYLFWLWARAKKTQFFWSKFLKNTKNGFFRHFFFQAKFFFQSR